MAVLADQSLDVVDDRLAARNALILAAAQALAGGNERTGSDLGVGTDHRQWIDGCLLYTSRT